MVAVWLALIVFGAFGIEAALGFGCNVLAVTLAIHLLPLDQLLPLLVSLNLLVSLWITARHRHAVDLRLLLGCLLPLMLAGAPVGLALAALSPGRLLEALFGLFVLSLALLELRHASSGAAPRPLTPRAGAAALLAGGLMHGLYASGGPLAVYYVGRRVHDKGVFRATMSALWLALNTLLLTVYALRGLMTARVLALGAPQVLALGLGIAAGERLHARLDERAFRLLVFVLLAAGGVILLISTASAL